MNKDGIFFNQSFDKKRLKALIEWIFKTYGEKEALRVVEELKRIGFQNATKAGISLGLHELLTPPEKAFLISNAEEAINITHQDFNGARITATERSQRIVDTWHRVSESLRKLVVENYSTYDKLNPIYIMALSGARGNFSQVRQLVGMRGLMADPQGQIISFPIRSNLREGLSLTEYFISCSGARKGLVDTALRTADTGYLTRRLVDVSHHVVVKRVACNTHKGIVITALKNHNKVLLALKDRLVGRVLAEDITLIGTKNRNLLSKKNSYVSNSNGKHGFQSNSTVGKAPILSPSTLKVRKAANNSSLNFTNKIDNDNFVVYRDQEIFPELAYLISNAQKQVVIRSVLTCSLNNELCQLCYGWSLSQGNLVALGEAVGVIAAQSIGEPGTQLTMRTFHTGGVFSGDLLQELRAPHSGKISFSQAFQGLLIRTTHGKLAFLTKTPGEILVTALPYSKTVLEQLTPQKNKKSQQNFINYSQTRLSFQSLSMLFVRQGEQVEKNQLLAQIANLGEGGNQPIKSQQTVFAELSGRVVEIQGGSIKNLDFYKNESDTDQENEMHTQIEPETSGHLGIFHILSSRKGATSNPSFSKKKKNSALLPRKGFAHVHKEFKTVFTQQKFINLFKQKKRISISSTSNSKKSKNKNRNFWRKQSLLQLRSKGSPTRSHLWLFPSLLTTPQLFFTKNKIKVGTGVAKTLCNSTIYVLQKRAENSLTKKNPIEKKKILKSIARTPIGFNFIQKQSQSLKKTHLKDQTIWQNCFQKSTPLLSKFESKLSHQYTCPKKEHKKQTSSFYLRTIAQEGDLVEANYKDIQIP